MVWMEIVFVDLDFAHWDDLSPKLLRSIYIFVQNCPFVNRKLIKTEIRQGPPDLKVLSHRSLLNAGNPRTQLLAEEPVRWAALPT
ncbi:hypothetical protein BCD64_17435 [Nostoc sp. MBR 210]|nr:hypothetical protein BCD64_17435 [Nostoc sp. MBR 210]